MPKNRKQYRKKHSKKNILNLFINSGDSTEFSFFMQRSFVPGGLIQKKPMRPLLTVTFLLLVAVLPACKKHAVEPEPEPEVTKTLSNRFWFYQCLMDPGDGSGKWERVETDPAQYLEFKDSVQLETTVSYLKGFDRYQKLNDSVMLFINAATEQSVSMRYTLEYVDLLTLYPPCDEACGLKFVREQSYYCQTVMQ